MKIKIKNRVSDSNKEPIMLIFENNEDRKLIIEQLSNMEESTTKYCMYPEFIDRESIEKFMKIY